MTKLVTALRLPDELQAVDARSVVREELAYGNSLLPPRWGDLALRDAECDVAAWFRAASRRDISVTPEDIIMARKASRGGRPLSHMGLLDRLRLRAVASLIESELLETHDRSRGAHEAFRQAPLQVPNCRYVVKTDIAAYYQYIDHERLVDEVVAQIGDDISDQLRDPGAAGGDGQALWAASSE